LFGSSSYNPPPQVNNTNNNFGGGLFSTKPPNESISQPDGGLELSKGKIELNEQWGESEKPSLELSQKIGFLKQSQPAPGKQEPQAVPKIKDAMKVAEKKELKKDESVETAKKKPKVELKGTYIKTFDAGRKAFYQGSNFHITYDPYNKKFYTFNWI